MEMLKRGVAQMVECTVRDREVVGSSPATPTEREEGATESAPLRAVGGARNATTDSFDFFHCVEIYEKVRTQFRND